VSEHAGHAIRAFFALPLGAEARAELTRRLAALRAEPWSREVRWVPSENLHVTLRFLGKCSPAQIETLIERVGSVASATRPFHCTLEETSAFGSPSRARVIIARVSAPEELVALAGRLDAEAVTEGVPAEPQRFRPHVTLGRVRRPPLRGLTLEGTPERCPISVGQVVLFRSELGQGGTRYTPLAKLPLGTP
jgi:2'-5' RNA ligase